MKKLLLKKKLTFTIIFLLAIFIPVIVCATLYYSKSVLNLIYNSYSQFTNEFVSHDVEIIKDDFREKKEKLLLVRKSLAYFDQSNSGLYLDILNNAFKDIFHEIALLDSENKLTENKYLSIKEEEIAEAISNSKDKEILLLNYPENRYFNNTGIFILKIDPLKFGDKTYTAMVGFCSFDNLYERIQLNISENKYNIFLFFENGDYFLPYSKYLSNVEYKNFNDHIKSVRILKDTEENIFNSINKKQNVTYIFKNNRELTHESITYVENSNCFYCFSLPERILRSQNKKIIELTSFLIIALFITISVFISLFIFTFYNLSNLRNESKTKEEFLSTMSHEIRTPLNGIIGLIHLMQANIDDKDKLLYYFQKTSKTSDYLLQLINNILDISKFDNGKIKLANNPFDIEEMLDSIVSINRDAMLQKKINFEVKRNIFCSTIYGDEIRIQQIIMNLIGNAIKFTQEQGTITFTVIQENTFETDEISTIFTISDNGCGISKEFLKHIFEAFSQERNKLKASQKGTGLGLAISHRLCEQMNGSLTVESKLGIGSTFIFSLPSKIATPKQVTDYILSSTNFNTEKEHNILIAEDNELSADILDEVFNDVKFKHKIVRDGKQVIEEFSESEIGEYDVILMDIQMPYYDGYEATQIIRKLKRADAKTVTIIACSANAFEEDKENAIKAGMNSFIVKPVNINSLLETLGK